MSGRVASEAVQVEFLEEIAGRIAALALQGEYTEEVAGRVAGLALQVEFHEEYAGRVAGLAVLIEYLQLSVFPQPPFIQGEGLSLYTFVQGQRLRHRRGKRNHV